MASEQEDKPVDKSKLKWQRQQIILSIADTTWRMFTPTLIGIFGGYQLDLQYDTLPIFFILGTILGFLAAGFLVMRQLKRKI